MKQEDCTPHPAKPQSSNGTNFVAKVVKTFGWRSRNWPKLLTACRFNQPQGASPSSWCRDAQTTGTSALRLIKVGRVFDEIDKPLTSSATEVDNSGGIGR